LKKIVLKQKNQRILYYICLSGIGFWFSMGRGVVAVNLLTYCTTYNMQSAGGSFPPLQPVVDVQDNNQALSHTQTHDTKSL
jgi:hypothetical protein